jgi:hypothetical protein
MFSQSGATGAQKKGGDTQSKSDTQSVATSAVGGNSPVRDIYNMLKSGPGAEIDKLMKETGAK